ncbi:hypothetical protein OUZ56_028226 [Daphnia magna]|uniref:Uncharacterized protein n=1 Tax=Daphnia magna TaxID=35525 RepID=A0ABR0B381_9CRUS|nr:hypothetical protein OUZ56_028226 [Daphnia magna]
MHDMWRSIAGPVGMACVVKRPREKGNEGQRRKKKNVAMKRSKRSRHHFQLRSIKLKKEKRAYCVQS